tara:strand:- start:466 stop:2151 length:1686 start_codon:yes stop_codon:yes gene_type:complete
MAGRLRLSWRFRLRRQRIADATSTYRLLAAVFRFAALMVAAVAVLWGAAVVLLIVASAHKRDRTPLLDERVAASRQSTKPRPRGAVHGLHCNLSDVVSREDASRQHMGLPPRRRTVPAVVLPNLRSIHIHVPKCASTELHEFFTHGKGLFKRAGAEEGMGMMHAMRDDPVGLVVDLGETKVSRRAKREFFTFAFVCNPVKRLVSAYGTINKRSASLNFDKLNAHPYKGGGIVNFDGGGTLHLKPGSASSHGLSSQSILVPSFATMPRTEEPARFARFVSELHTWNLSTFEMWPYAVDTSQQDVQMRAGLRAMSTAGHGALVTVPDVSGSAGSSKTRASRDLGLAFRRGETSAIHNVEHIETGTWNHARSIVDYLTVPDTDGEPRRLDFVGHVETLREDLLQLLKIWKVPLSELTNKQRAILRSDSSRHHNANAHEGFAFEAGLELRRSILTNMTDAALGCVAMQFEHDFTCFNYTLPAARRACDPPAPLDGRAGRWVPLPDSLKRSNSSAPKRVPAPVQVIKPAARPTRWVSDLAGRFGRSPGRSLGARTTDSPPVRRANM